MIIKHHKQLISPHCVFLARLNFPLVAGAREELPCSLGTERDLAVVKFNQVLAFLAEVGGQRAVVIEVTAVAGKKRVPSVLKLEGNKRIGAPRNILRDLELVVCEARVTLSNRVKQVDLRMNGELHCPLFGTAHFGREALQLIVFPTQVAFVDAFQSPPTVRLVAHGELSVRFLLFGLAREGSVLVRGEVTSQVTL